MTTFKIYNHNFIIVSKTFFSHTSQETNSSSLDITRGVAISVLYTKLAHLTHRVRTEKDFYEVKFDEMISLG